MIRRRLLPLMESRPWTTSAERGREPPTIDCGSFPVLRPPLRSVSLSAPGLPTRLARPSQLSAARPAGPGMNRRSDAAPPGPLTRDPSDGRTPAIAGRSDGRRVRPGNALLPGGLRRERSLRITLLPRLREFRNSEESDRIICRLATSN